MTVARSLRLVVHALDRSGPPVLALGFLRWLRRTHPDLSVEVLAFRGGALQTRFVAAAPLTIVLDEAEAWDPVDPPRARAAELRERLSTSAPVDVNLLVSVAAGQVLPLLGEEIGPITTWSVEVGEDLHWVDATPVGLAERTERWLAGSSSTAVELGRRCPAARHAQVVPEFVDDAATPTAAAVERARQELGGAPDRLLVVGAGIGTHRKGIDLFLEAAVAHRRAGGTSSFAWIGGEADDLHPLVAQDLDRADFDHLVLAPGRDDIEVALAAADVFLHPARADAFPLVCLQAALRTTPVIAFGGVGGRDEMFGPTALGGPYPDLTSLVSVLADLQDPRRRSEAGDRQRDWVRSRFTTDAAAPALFAALEGDPT